MTKQLEVKRGEKFGKLTIIEEVEPHVYPNGKTRRKFLCKCECGNEVEVLLKLLKNGSTKSCGCYQKEITSKTNKNIINMK